MVRRRKKTATGTKRIARKKRAPVARKRTSRVSRSSRKKTNTLSRQMDQNLYGSKAEKRVDLTNKKMHWNVYKTLQKEVNKAWMKFKNNVQKRASLEEISQSKNHLLLLLGECDYMAREYQRQSLRARH